MLGAENDISLLRDLATRGVSQYIVPPFSDDEPRSVADVSSPETLLDVRNWKKAMKAAKKSKQD